MDRMDAAEGGDEETAPVVDFRRARSSLGPRRRALIQILTKEV